MKKILYSILLLSILFFIGCEDKKEESESLPYKDLSVIYLGKEKINCLDNWSESYCNDYPGFHRYWYCYYRGTEPTINESGSYNWFSNGVSWIHRDLNKVKYIHYYVNDNYIEYEEVGGDQLESIDLNDYEIIDYNEI